MKKNTAPLAGFQDLKSDHAYLKEKICQDLAQIFRSYGLLPIKTPHIEYAQNLIKEGDEQTDTNKQIYKFLDNGGRKVALRFDHTLPLARFVSRFRYDLALPFKRYVIGDVFRGENPQSGRYREFTQCDFDILGSNKLLVDFEIIQIINSCLLKLGIEDFVIKLNHRKLIDAMLNILGVVEHKNKILQITDKFYKIGYEGVLEKLTKQDFLTDDKAKIWADILNINQDNPSKMIAEVSNRLNIKNDTLFGEAASEIQQVFKLLDKAGIKDSRYSLDFKIARGLDYYTGIVYETFIKSNPKIGSICSGGRYDNLSQQFIKDKIPAAGASIGLDRLISVLYDDLSKKIDKPLHLLIGLLDDECTDFAIELANNFRKNNINTQLYYEKTKIAKQFSYAQKQGFLFLLAVGKREQTKSEFTLASLTNGKKTHYQGLAELTSFLVDYIKQPQKSF